MFRDLSFSLSPGMRLGLAGPNGSGKTTLLRVLKGEIGADAGTIERADGLRMVYFDQGREQLDPAAPLREGLGAHGDSVIYRDRTIHIAGWAKRFLFRADQLDTPVGRFSGGERARIVIARLMLQPADLLLLDEPTNDLDIPTLEVLEESLTDFPGALVLVTHDRYMLDRVSTVVLGLNGEGGAEVFADYSQWEQARAVKPARVGEGTGGAAAGGRRAARRSWRIWKRANGSRWSSGSWRPSKRWRRRVRRCRRPRWFPIRWPCSSDTRRCRRRRRRWRSYMRGGRNLKIRQAGPVSYRGAGNHARNFRRPAGGKRAAKIGRPPIEFSSAACRRLAALMILPQYGGVGQGAYDMVLANGRVMDPASGLDAVRNVGIRGGKIAAVSETPLEGRTVLDVAGLGGGAGLYRSALAWADAGELRLQGARRRDYRARDGSGRDAGFRNGIAAREGKALINFGATSGHIPARMAVMHDSGTLLPRDAAKRAATPEEQPADLRTGAPRAWTKARWASGWGSLTFRRPPARKFWNCSDWRRERKTTIYVHMRNGGPVEPGVIDALQEVIADAAATGASLHVVHITSMGLRETPLCLQMIAGARRSGLDVTTEDVSLHGGHDGYRLGDFR